MRAVPPHHADQTHSNMYSMCNGTAMSGGVPDTHLPFHPSPYELPGGAQVYYNDPALHYPNFVPTPGRNSSGCGDSPGSTDSLLPRHSPPASATPPSNPLQDPSNLGGGAGGLCYANLDHQQSNGYYSQSQLHHPYSSPHHSVGREMTASEYDLTSAAAGYVQQQAAVAYGGYLDASVPFRMASYLPSTGTPTHHHPSSPVSADPLRDSSPTGLSLSPPNAGSGQPQGNAGQQQPPSSQNNQSGNMPTYKWMHIKRNVPKPRELWHYNLFFVLFWIKYCFKKRSSYACSSSQILRDKTTSCIRPSGAMKL